MYQANSQKVHMFDEGFFLMECGMLVQLETSVICFLIVKILYVVFGCVDVWDTNVGFWQSI